MNRSSVSLLALVLAPGLAQAGESITIRFVDHITAEMIEQDVYVPGSDAGKVFRVTTENVGEHSEAMVYRTVAPVEHAPMDKTKIGPYDAGAELGFTLGDWLSASGTGELTCEGDNGSLRVEFENLVPDGLYTMWNFFAGQQLAKFHTYDLPLGAPDGSDSIFRADGKGKAIYEAAFQPCLQGTTAQLMAGLAIAYHSDEQTHGYEPGPMGNKSHIHLFAMLPEQAEMPN